MKTINLGRVILFLITFTLISFASIVKATLDKNQIFSGEEARLTIKAEGKNVVFPDIKDIGGFPVINISNNSQVVYINGKLNQSKSVSYTFAPNKDVIIPSYKVIVDGNEYHTNELQLKVVKPTQSASGSPIILELNASKTTAMVGEPIELLLKFKLKHGEKIDRVNIAPPQLENFWVEQIPGEKRSIDGDYEVVTYKFLITPQKSGELKIPPTYVNVGKYEKMNSAFDDPFFDNSFFNQIRWKKIYSNPLTIDVKPLPNNLELYGHFMITANVDKRKVEANEPVNLTIKVKGEGNIDDIKKFNLKIPNAMIYNNEPKINKRLANGTLKGEFIQKIAIVADRNYTIPSLELNYYDKDLKKPVTIKTNPIDITVVGTPKTRYQEPKVEVSKSSETISKNEVKKSISTPINSTQKWIYFILGLIVGTILSFIIYKVLNYKPKKEQSPITKEMKKVKDDKELYKLLLPYSKDDYIKDKVQKLEANIYKGEKNKIDKDELIAYFEDMIL